MKISNEMQAVFDARKIDKKEILYLPIKKGSF
jgi:hypothetical protein